MLHKAGWAIGIVFLLTHLVVGQTPEPAQNIPLPKSPAPAPLGGVATPQGVQIDVLTSDRQPLFPSANKPQSPLFYVGADYLLWWVNHGPSPALLTTAPNNGLNTNPITGAQQLTGGILGQPGTTPLFTSSNLDYGAISGLRVSAGMFLEQNGIWSVEGGGFYLQNKSINYTAAGNANGTPLLTIPFIDASTGQQNALIVNSQVGAPGSAPYLTGSINIHSDLQVWGYALNAVAHSIRLADRSIDLIFGFRAVALDENLAISQNITAQQAGAITLQYPTVGQGASNYYNVPQGGSVYVLDSLWGSVRRPVHLGFRPVDCGIDRHGGFRRHARRSFHQRVQHRHGRNRRGWRHKDQFHHARGCFRLAKQHRQLQPECFHRAARNRI
jgi:hypothetical protein